MHTKLYKRQQAVLTYSVAEYVWKCKKFISWNSLCRNWVIVSPFKSVIVCLLVMVLCDKPR